MSDRDDPLLFGGLGYEMRSIDGHKLFAPIETPWPKTLGDVLDQNGDPIPPWQNVNPREDQKMSKSVQLYARRKNGRYVPLADEWVFMLDDGSTIDADTGMQAGEKLDDPESIMAPGESVVLSVAVVDRAMGAFFSYGDSLNDWQKNPRSAMEEALRVALGEALSIDVQKLGAFLAGEGVITIKESCEWSRALGYEAMSGNDEQSKAEVMVSLVRRLESRIEVVLSNGDGDVKKIGTFTGVELLQGEDDISVVDSAGNTVATSAHTNEGWPMRWRSVGSDRSFDALSIKPVS